jgi:hypothetical protein
MNIAAAHATPSSLLTPAGSYDLSAIVRRAWAFAHAAVVPTRPIRGFTPAPRPTLREAFKEALRRAWNLARGQRACIEHHAVPRPRPPAGPPCRPLSVRS